MPVLLVVDGPAFSGDAATRYQDQRDFQNRLKAACARIDEAARCSVERLGRLFGTPTPEAPAMPTHDFILRFTLPDRNGDLLDHADALYENGCSDALLCVRNGALEIDFHRDGATLEAAVASALADVRKVLPGAVQDGPAVVLQDA